MSEISSDDGVLFIKDIITGEMVPVDEMEPPSNLWSNKSAASADSTNEVRYVTIPELRRGDVVFVSEFSLVSVGQMLLRLITGDVFGSGGHDAVHCFIVVDADKTHVGVAHVTNSGACINLISTPEDPAQLRMGRVYRMKADRYGDVGDLAAQEAIALVEAKVPFGMTRSLASGFRDAKVGGFIQRRKDCRRKSVEMFCTEFVMTVIQNAVIKQDHLNNTALKRATDIDGSACTPMQLESFLRDNGRLFGDWYELGLCRFQYA